MSQENVETVRRAVEAINRGALDAWTAEADPGIEWYVLPDDPNPGPYRGYQAIAEMVGMWQGTFVDFRGEAQEYIDAGEHVIVPMCMRGRPRASEAEVVLDEVYVCTIRDGKIVEVREYWTRAQAFDAVGLRE